MARFEAPNFKSGDDVELWLYRYNKVASMNKLDAITKLQYVEYCFEEELQLWFMHEDFTIRDLFVEVFNRKFAKKKNMSKIIEDITNTKMTPNESIYEYVRKFERKRIEYTVEVKKSKQTNKAKLSKPEASNSSTNTTGNDSDVDDEVEIKITEHGFLKYFIKGISSMGLRRQIRSAKLATLEEVYAFIGEIYDSHDEESADAEDELSLNLDHNRRQKEDNTNTKTDSSVDELIAGIKN